MSNRAHLGITLALAGTFLAACQTTGMPAVDPHTGQAYPQRINLPGDCDGTLVNGETPRYVFRGSEDRNRAELLRATNEYLAERGFAPVTNISDFCRESSDNDRDDRAEPAGPSTDPDDGKDESGLADEADPNAETETLNFNMTGEDWKNLLEELQHTA